MKIGTIPTFADAEEAEIQREITSAPDAPEVTDEQAALSTTFAKAFPELAATIPKRREKRKPPPNLGRA